MSIRLDNGNAIFVRRLYPLSRFHQPSCRARRSAAEFRNYLAFLPLPAIMIGLYAVQRPLIARSGLAGAVLYGFAFIYFTSTTLKALTDHVSSYEVLWEELGHTYTVHGALMIVGGALFGSATLRARVFPRWTPVLFLAGLGLNLVLTFIPVDDLYQTLGTTLRNAGLVGMGWASFSATTSRSAV